MDRGRRVGKRLKAYLDWLVGVDDPEAFSVEKLDELDEEAIEEDLDPPDRAALVAQWRRDGWPGPIEPDHQALIDIACYERILGEPFVHGVAGPRVVWRYGSWRLAQHRAAVARYLRIRNEERAIDAERQRR